LRLPPEISTAEADRRRKIRWRGAHDALESPVRSAQQMPQTLEVEEGRQWRTVSRVNFFRNHVNFGHTPAHQRAVPMDTLAFTSP
jgi:hypothetical protein